MKTASQNNSRCFQPSVSIRTVVCALLVSIGVIAPAFALKHAPVEHQLKVDPAIPVWTPGEVKINPPEEEFNLVGADVMDEITFGWAKLYREAYSPKMSVTVEARASGAGAPGLVNGAHAAPVGRELLPAEEKMFVDKFGYKPFEIRVATGSVGSPGVGAGVSTSSRGSSVIPRLRAASRISVCHFGGIRPTLTQ